jgi:hypothetical protein
MLTDDGLLTDESAAIVEKTEAAIEKIECS